MTASGVAWVAPAPVDAAPSFWVPIADLPSPRLAHESIALADGRVLIVGAGTAVELFNPATSTFVATGSTRFGHGNGFRAARLVDGRVLVVGGEGALQKAETFDPVAGAFTETAGELLHPHAYHTLTVLGDGRVLVAGGRSGPSTPEHGAAEIFDPATGTFSMTGGLHRGREGHAAARLPDGRVLVVGGVVQTQPGFGLVLRSAEIYDPATGSFGLAGSMFWSRGDPEAVSLPDGRVLVFGGSTNAAERFDPETGRFQEVGGLSVAHSSATATRLPDGRVLVAGGYIATGPVTTDIAELYWPERRAFTRTARLTQARQQHAAAPLADGRVLVTGGSQPGALLRSAEVFSLGDELPPAAVAPGPSMVGGRIRGRVVDETSGLPIADVFVNVQDGRGAFQAFGKTNADGEYYSDAGLPSGDYQVTTSNTQGYIDEAYGGAACAGCDPRIATPVTVAADATVEGVDFVLAIGPQIRGQVTGEDTGLGLPGVFVEVLNASGRRVSQVLTDASGRYSNGAGLPPGDYYVRTNSSRDAYIDELHDDVPCAFRCDFRTGTPVPVTDSAPEVTFLLTRGGVISGSTTDAGAGTVLPGVTVELHGADGASLTSWIASPAGYTFPGLPDGTFYLRTQNSLGYVNQVFDGLACLTSCSAASGTALDVTAGAPVTANFALGRDGDADGDGILNTVDKDAATGADESGVASDDFSDLPLGGATAGTLSGRRGWTVQVMDLGPGGVQAALSGGGAGGATLDTCPAGDPERTILDAAAESVSIACGGGGSTTLRALFAAPFVQLRKPLTGAGIVVDLPTAHGATLGSPVTASFQNTEAITVRLVDDADLTFGTLQLDPGESVDASVAPDGSAQVTVRLGTVTAEVRGESLTLRSGESRVFPAPPLDPRAQIDELARQVRALLASGDIHRRSVARWLLARLRHARHWIVSHPGAARRTLCRLAREISFLARTRRIEPIAADTLLPPLRRLIESLPCGAHGGGGRRCRRHDCC